MSLPNALGLFLLLTAVFTVLFARAVPETPDKVIVKYAAAYSLLLSLGAYLILL